MSFRRGRGGQGNGGSRFSGGGGPRDGDNAGGRGSGAVRREAAPGRLSNHTSDASMASARIFIGNLPTNDPRLTKEFLEERFSRYGQILGMSILKGFGFIQFSEKGSAEEAIRDAQQTEILNHRIDVKHVKSGKDGASPGGMPEGPAANRDFGGYRDRSPLRSREPDMPPLGREHDMPPNRGRDPSLGRAGPRDFGGRERDWNRGREMDPYGVEPPMLDHDARDIHPRDPYAPPPLPSDPHRGSFGGSVPPGPVAPMANEVEIIVTSKMGPVRQYAERIESRLKGQGMAVDVLFPHEEIPLRKVLSDLSARGTLFGIVVTPLNQEQGSITLNILFGQPEEHRNMPVEDAFCLLSTAFNRHKGLTATGADRKIQIGIDAHPANIQHLINLLQENRPLTVIEYDRLIRYLSEKKDRQVRLEMADDPAGGRMGIGGANHHHPAMSSLMPGGGGGMNPLGSMGAMSTPGLGSGGGAGTGVAGVKSGDPQSELQQRILNILNAGSASGVTGSQMAPAGVPAPVPVPAPHQTGTSVPSSLPWVGGGTEVNSAGPLPFGQNMNDPSSVHHKPMDGHMQSGQPMMKHFSGPNMGSPNSRPMQQPNSYNPNPYMNKRY